MDFKSFLNDNSIPPKPGTIPIPADHVRLYHYFNNPGNLTDNKLKNSIKQHGIDINQARGSKYGESNLVWASTQKPHNKKIYAEFSVAWNDNRWALGRPLDINDVNTMIRQVWDVAFYNSIKPEEILALYFPWYFSYYYLKDNNMIPKVLSGEFDYLLDRRDSVWYSSDEAKAIRYIKKNYAV